MASSKQQKVLTYVYIFSVGNRFVAKPVSFELLFLELRGPLNGLWFECFHALKVDKTKLLQIRDKYRKDPKICVIEGIRAWLENTDPPPSWESLVPVLRYVLLETELADRIERLYVDPSKYPNYQPRMPTFSSELLQCFTCTCTIITICLKMLLHCMYVYGHIATFFIVFGHYLFHRFSLSSTTCITINCFGYSLIVFTIYLSHCGSVLKCICIIIQVVINLIKLHLLHGYMYMYIL